MDDVHVEAQGPGDERRAQRAAGVERLDPRRDAQRAGKEVRAGVADDAARAVRERLDRHDFEQQVDRVGDHRSAGLEQQRSVEAAGPQRGRDRAGMRSDSRGTWKAAAEVEHSGRVTVGAEVARQARQERGRTDVLVHRARPGHHDPPGVRVEVGRDEMGRKRLHGQSEPGGGARGGRDLAGGDAEPRHRAGETLNRDSEADPRDTGGGGAVEFGDRVREHQRPAGTRARQQ